MVDDLKSKVEYYKNCKDSTNPKFQADLADDPRFRYFVECESEMILAIPILEKVHNKNLILYDFTISPIHAKALQMAVKYFENFVTKILFDNCGLNDESFAKIIDSCNQLKDFKSIIYRKNEFGMQSA